MLICSSILTSSLHSQTTSISNDKLRDAAKLIEKGKIDAERVKLLNDKIVFLNQRIAFKDSIIANHDAKDVAQAAIIETYKAEVKNLTEQRDIAAVEVKKQNKKFRNQKRKTVFIAIAGPAVTAALFILLK